MSKYRSTGRRLPPLLSVSPVRVRTPTPRSATSRYHKNCCQPSRLQSPGPGAYLDVYTRRSSMARTPRTPKASRQNSVKVSSALRSRRVEDFLDTHGDFLEEYILEKVDLDLLERWIIRKTQRECKLAMKTRLNGEGESPEKPNLSRWKFCVHADKRQMLQELTSTLYSTSSKAHVLTELSRTVASSVNSTSWTLYIYNQDSMELYNFIREEEHENDLNGVRTTSVEKGETLAAFVARKKESMRIRIADMDLRFPDGVNSEAATYVLCHPILQPDGELSGVLELYRTESDPEFHEEDEEIVKSYLVWGGIALHYSELYGDLTKQKELNTFLLSVLKSIFQDMISMDTLIVKIMMYARKLVNADRASLFLVDGRSSELFARIFDVSGQDKNSDDGMKSADEIRFPIGKGIAGYVAMTGESLNIHDAYNDDRFNRSIDQQTGYITKNLLCMPIFTRGSVIGVVQMVNKINGHFTKDDEEAFATFAIYCGLALHHAKLYDKIRRSEQKYKVALEILSYHNTCSEEELNMIQKIKLPVDPDTIKEFKFCPSCLSSDEKVASAIFMMNDLFNNQTNSINMESDVLSRFALTVRKNYRRVPYHNWAHGFTVANSMYAILKHCPSIFTPLEELSLYVACLCHDLDHRGKNNQFLAVSASPLAAIYTTSTLEHHHFNMTVSILQQEGHNILRNLSSSEYKQVLSNIKHCILATDLALFFSNKAKLTEINKAGEFDWNFEEHRKLLQSIVMTGCDLCASTKAWDQQKETVKVIFEEFYDQGDAEKAQGRQPIPMMDRNKEKEQPLTQVGFLEGICIPCYDLIYSLLPGSLPMLENCKANLEIWKSFVQQMDEETLNENSDKGNKNKNVNENENEDGNVNED